MASDNHNPQRPSGSQPIPLQDLSRPPDTAIADGRRRNNSGGGVDGLGIQRRSLIGHGSTRRRYERIGEDYPTSRERRDFDSTRDGQDGSEGEGDGPVDDPGGFQQAITSVGLSFDGPSSHHLPGMNPSNNRSPLSGANILTSDEELSSLNNSRPDLNDNNPGYGSPTDTLEGDTTPLNDGRYMQPISGFLPSREQTRGRGRGHSNNFSEVSGSRLGDDLPNLENGLGKRPRGSTEEVRSSHDRARSLSPSASGSAISRASSMMKMMSQRVVNLSNEPELVEQSIQRESSLKQARLEGPPPLPAMSEYAHDALENGVEDTKAPPEKKSPFSFRTKAKTPSPKPPVPRVNPLRGNSLGIFPPENKLRRVLCEMLVNPLTEPIILILIIIQTVILAVESGSTKTRAEYWGGSNFDYVFFALFVIYTLELIGRTIVSGLIWNPHEYSTLDRSGGLKKAIFEKGRSFFVPQAPSSTTRKAPNPGGPQVSVLRSFTGMQPPLAESDDPLHQQRMRLARRAFLRHSFNRLDFIAVVSYWISFILCLSGTESASNIYVFRMLSCLRILRLLNLTRGTSVILRSLKKAAPLLVHVAFLISFFWLLFGIVGVQIFKSSLRRTCVWVDPENVQNFTLNSAPDDIQFCGGHLNNSTGNPMPWLFPDGSTLSHKPKGYLCPQGSRCVEGDNPYGGTISFDNLFQSLELVFVVMSSNTFTDILYYTTDSDYLASALFFAAGFVLLSLWLVNLLVAVITSSFQVIREESKRSAFTSEQIDNVEEEEEFPQRVSRLKAIYDKTYWIWVVAITFDLVVQGLRSSSMGSGRAALINSTQTIVTFTLLVDIFLRLGSDWRHFHQSSRNWVDLGLALITAIMQIPAIKINETLYAGLSIFQILRVYRIVLAFSLTRDLIMVVFGNAVGLLNLIIFVFLITFLTAIFATQLFRGQIPTMDEDGETIAVSFFHIFNSFVGMYQVLSSENWTDILYNATESGAPWGTAWISGVFFIMWFILANFIVLNMFIAVIQESFDVSEDEKRLQQVKAFLQQKHLSGSSHGNLSLSTIFKLGRDPKRYKDPLDHGPAALEMLLKDAVVNEFLDEQGMTIDGRPTDGQTANGTQSERARTGLLFGVWKRITSVISDPEPNPFYSKLKFSRAYEDLDPMTMAKEVLSASEQRKQAQRHYLQKYPSYNKALYLFSPTSFIRRICQRIVGPGRGTTRIEGVDPYKPIWFSFSAFIYAAIVAMVVLACITTPLYQREYFQNHHFSVRNWFVWSDMGFAIVFTVEAIIKVIADGFFWTPNAYFRGSWGFIDGIVLVTLWINVITSLYKDGGISRAVGAFKALRALRLLNVSDSARDTFHSVIVLGGWKVVSAAFVSLSFLVPFAIYGLNLFNGKMRECNDDDFGSTDLDYCVGEYLSSPYAWDVLAPRVVANPYFSFDDFGSSLFILFQIVSQEGWTDVLWSGMSITGVNQQPEPFASQQNGLFFIVFNLLGAVFVLTLFVSVFMRNYTEQTGVAFLTSEQRSWLELRKHLRQISPSKRSINNESKKFKTWCYRVAVKKHGRWQRCVTAILLLHVLLLILEYYPEVEAWIRIREYIFLAFTICYIANIIIRILGLTWHRFRRSSWDIYSLISVFGTFATTILALIRYDIRILNQLHKIFLVSIALLLIPRNNQLDQLFKTAAASLTAIGNLLATWFVLFLVYAIALTQTFGLTKFNEGQAGNINFRNVPKALILLFRMSCGEGWNELMEDFATMVPPYCVDDKDFFESDCGSPGWARGLFISWNILSMYIFVSLFVSLIFESFSYVYQRSSGLYTVSREDIRRFKQAWATFDPDGTGYISKLAFPRLLGELSGIFEMRIYDGEFSVGRILEECRLDRRDSEIPHVRQTDGIDLEKLSRLLDRIPVDEIRKRRARMNVFYEEVLVSADPDFGISFTSCLMILAHYNVITDSKSLRLEEFLRRRARLQRVEEAVRRNVVIGFFDTLYWSREFRRKIASRHSARMTAVPQFSVPEIYVDDQDDLDNDSLNGSETADYTSPMLSPISPRSPTTGQRSRSNTLGRSSESGPSFDSSFPRGSSSRTGSPSQSDRFNISPGLSPSAHSRSGSAYFPGIGQPSGSDSGRGDDRQRQGSAVSVQDVMQSLDNSAWGESIRRSFSTRRPGPRR